MAVVKSYKNLYSETKDKFAIISIKKQLNTEKHQQQILQ